MKLYSATIVAMIARLSPRIERGAGMVEYAMLMALIVLVTVTFLEVIADTIGGLLAQSLAMLTGDV
ncbi:MAG: hypothetical protein ACFCVK_08255 [Acidimicrobiales bacterium]